MLGRDERWKLKCDQDMNKPWLGGESCSCRVQADCEVGSCDSAAKTLNSVKPIGDHVLHTWGCVSPSAELTAAEQQRFKRIY